MKKHPGSVIPLPALAMVLAMAIGGVAPAGVLARPSIGHLAHPQRAPAAEIRIDNAWIRTAPPGAMMLAGYMSLHNDSDRPLRLLSAESAAFGMVEAHRTLVEGGVSRMRPAGEVTIPAHRSLRFEPGGLHLMLMQPTRTIKSGDVLHFQLHISDGSTREVEFPVRADAPPTR